MVTTSQGEQVVVVADRGSLELFEEVHVKRKRELQYAS